MKWNLLASQPSLKEASAWSYMRPCSYRSLSTLEQNLAARVFRLTYPIWVVFSSVKPRARIPSLRGCVFRPGWREDGVSQTRILSRRKLKESLSRTRMSALRLHARSNDEHARNGSNIAWAEDRTKIEIGSWIVSKRFC